MKAKKKRNQSDQPQTPPGAGARPLTPHEIAVRNFLKYAALATMLMALLAGVAYRPDLFGLGKGTLRLASGKEIPLREPKLNDTPAPGPAPTGMVWIPGGEFYMGIDDPSFEDAWDVHLVYVDGFWMDKCEVTNAQFAKFVAATGYVTDAEKMPTKEEFPDVPVSELKPFSIVFRKPAAGERVDLRNHLSWWDVCRGASWKNPEGPGTGIKGHENHPVVHISHNDASAYCKWAGMRLATEAEWEFAARGGLDRKLFPWGDEFLPEGKWMANIWQGPFPYENTKEDGFEGSAPVGSFPANAYGLHDMSGNVWEWCADWYQPRYYHECDQGIRNPQGPLSGWDPLEPGSPKRVQRGSFLCEERYCARYILGTRGKGEVTSAQSHCGFRCVKDAK